MKMDADFDVLDFISLSQNGLEKIHCSDIIKAQMKSDIVITFINLDFFSRNLPRIDIKFIQVIL